MKNRTRLITLTLLTLLIFVNACSSSTPTATTPLDGGTLAKERCSACHDFTYVERYRNTATEWKVIVDTMIARGARLTPAEETLVVNWLAANYGK